MALIAFCAIALVENVTNAHPVGRGGEERREGWRDSGREEGGRAEGQEEEEEEEGRQERTKTRQKGWTRRCYKKTQTEIDTENSSQADNSVLSRCGNNSRKTSTVS